MKCSETIPSPCSDAFASINSDTKSSRNSFNAALVSGLLSLWLLSSALVPASAGIIFEAEFNDELAGWTAVQPAAGEPYSAGPMRWVNDTVNGGFSEGSNIFTGNDVAPMLINDAVAGETFTFQGRMNMGDNDGAGLVFGFQDENNFYRISFGVQDRAAFPFASWSFDQKVDGVSTILAGDDGNDAFVTNFTPTRGQAVNVVIEVTAGNVLNLSVVDNVESDTPVTIPLVEAMTLPSSAAGQVGLMVWGMAGGNPGGVLFTDLSLTPVSLVNTPPPGMLDEWTSVVPGNAVGETAGTVGNWGLAWGPDGVVGTLNESSNGNLDGTDISGNTHIDFSAPTFVAGNASWKDYEFTARITPRDNDGHGVIVRYQDPDNFYRIALASQDDSTGNPWKGVSGQKKVDGVWSEIFHDPASFVSPDDVPYDITTTVTGNRLEVVVIGDPEGGAERHSFGPFDIAGATVDSGKIGIFSWGMDGLEVDFVRVESNLLFSDSFNDFPGWTSVQPSGASSYIDGPLRWLYDTVNGGFSESSNIYTDAPGFSPSAVAPMIINDAVAGDTFTYRARMRPADNDGAGLVFGYQDERNFYRITFAIQNRDGGFPWHGWSFDRMVDGQSEILAGDDGSLDFDLPTFVPIDDQAFDVIIEVGQGNVLNLTVDDDPVSGFPFTIPLIESLTLPTSAAGQVGLMTWGMSGGGFPPGIFFSEMSLEPGPLANNPPNPLPDWTNFVPANDLGEAAANPGNWGLAFGQDGPFGTLYELSNANLPGSDLLGNTHIDFSASTLVAGDENWTDYLLTARIIPGDNDGHGVVVRFKDPENFYRIALASQEDGDGRPWQGVSVQKKVNGIWSEVFHDESASFIPPNNVPYDILVTVNGNSLEFVITGDPDGAAETHFYGPFEITTDTVDNGKIGFFSWGMNPLQVDFVQVERLVGIPLQVNSLFGNPDPPVGLQSFDFGAQVTATVEDVVDEDAGIRRLVQGWTGSGSTPDSGTSKSVTMNLNRFSILTWEWISEFRLQASGDAGGSVSGFDQDWYGEGAMVSLSAVPDAGFAFSGWSGDSFSKETPLVITINSPRSLTANFAADTDGDGLADDWELANLGDLSSGTNDDPDNDGVSNAEEFIRGTDPSFKEELVSDDGFPSRWENVKRDPDQSGLWQVQDFGGGYKGPTENTNAHRGADTSGGPTPLFPAENMVPAVSFEGPRLIVSNEEWDPAWKDYTVETTVVIGDNDGSTVYFRYQDEENWMRVNMEGEDAPADWRPPTSVSVQKRVDGIFSEVAVDDFLVFDPADLVGFKQYRVSVTANGSDFEISVVPFDTFAIPPSYSSFDVAALNFADSSLSEGRVGFGSWGQSGSNPTDIIPVGAGVLFNDFKVTVSGAVVFEEDWQDALVSTEIPEGWENPFAGATDNDGDWGTTPHGLLQRSNDLTSTTGTLQNPKADGEGPILLAPDQQTTNYFLEMGFHPFDNDGIGFVYDFIDTDNYARALFRSESPTADGQIPQGVNISRKSGGVWSDIVVGDTSFVYQPTQPFGIEFANNNGSYSLSVWDFDNPDSSASYSWQDQAATDGNRFGVAVWGETDAHFVYARASSLSPKVISASIQITGVAVLNDQIVLDVDTSGAAYDVQMTTDLGAGWSTVATGETGVQWTGALPTGASSVFWRLIQQ